MRSSSDLPASAAVFSFERFRGQDYFAPLDGLRGLAILLVLLHHVPPPAGAWSWLATLAENGRYGVSLFFVISGFLICTLLLRERRDRGRIALGRFYARRALRLLPLYYVVLALQAALVFGLSQYSAENRALFAEKLPSYLFYYSNWLPTATAGPFFCAWSLAVEEQFYLGFGLLLVWVRPRWMPALIAAALGLKFAAFQTLGPLDTVATAWRVLFSYQEAILWGVLLAFALENRAVYDAIARWLRRGWTSPALGVALASWLALHPLQSANTWDAELAYLAMTLLLAAVVTRPAPAWLRRGLLAHIGQVSYGIYLLHMFAISAVKKLPHGDGALACFVVSAVAVVIAATLVHRWFERPVIAFYKRRFAAGAAGRTEPDEIAAKLPVPS